MANNYGVFLEIQRGGWESCSALQKQNPSTKQFTEHANAFDILKVYGAGWLREAGTAFGRNAAFLPNGTIFKRILSNDGNTEPFGVEDLYAAYGLMQASEKYKFGRTAEHVSRRLTRFLYYLVVVKMLSDVLTRANNAKPQPKDITRAILKLILPENEEALNELLDPAIAAIDKYLNQGMEDSAFNEPSYQNTFNGNLNGYIKWEQLGKTQEASPRFHSLVIGYCKTLGKRTGGKASPRDLITAAIKS